MPEPLNLTGVLDHMDDKIRGDKATIGDVVEAFGGRGYGPLLLAFAMIELLPTGAIPGVPTLVSILILLIASQLSLGRPVPWISKALARRSFSQSKFDKIRSKIRPLTRKLDKVIKPRLETFAGTVAARLAGIICILLACTMPPLELIPFASSAPSSAIALFGIGLSAQDGLILLIAFVTAGIAIAATIFWLAV